jgi:uncharacterized protein
MGRPHIELDVAPALRMFLAPRNRQRKVGLGCDATSSLGHVVESLGVPLTEVGSLVVNGRPEQRSYRPRIGDQVRVGPVARPQPLPAARFILDVHLGSLARRMRLVGLDTAYSNDRDDAELVELANAGQRVLLTKDRGLLQRRQLWLGAYVRGDQPDEQLTDVLGRFAPPLAPWTRCTACNGALDAVAKSEVEDRLLPGTRRTQQEFARCRECGRVYWPGAHSSRLKAIVALAGSAAGGQ